jgi:hypothetical protein
MDRSSCLSSVPHNDFDDLIRGGLSHTCAKVWWVTDTMTTNAKEEVVDTSEWHPQQEKILKEWAETSSVYSLMHESAHRQFQRRSMAFTIPVIVLSTFTGTANFATSSFDPEHRMHLSMIIGCLNLGAGLITTIAQFLRVNELVEGHRTACVAFGKFARNVSITLSLPLYDRATSGAVFLESSRQEYDRLLQQSPVIPLLIVKRFKAEMDLSEVHIPCFGIQTVDVYKPSSDVESTSEAVKTVRSSLMRLRSLHYIDDATERKLLKHLDSEKWNEDEEQGLEMCGGQC